MIKSMTGYGKSNMSKNLREYQVLWKIKYVKKFKRISSGDKKCES